MREAIWWAGLSVVIVFALLSFNPILHVVMLGKLFVQALLNTGTSNLRAVAGGNRWFYPPALLLHEAVFWVIASVAFVSTFVGSLIRH
jgi:hypothetical protein